MGDSQLRDSISIIAPQRAATPEFIPKGFERRQVEQERRIESIIA